MIDQTGAHKESFEPLRTNDRRADFLLSIERSPENLIEFMRRSTTKT